MKHLMAKLKEYLATLKKRRQESTDASEQAALDAQIADLERVEPDEKVTSQAPGAPQTPGSPPAADMARLIQESVTAAVAPLQEQVNALNGALAEEKKARHEAVKALEEAQKTKRGEEIGKLLDDALADGRVAAEKRDTWKERLEKDFDLTRGMLEELPKNPAVNRGKQSTNQNGKPPDSQNGRTTDTPAQYETKMARSLPREVMEYASSN